MSSLQCNTCICSAAQNSSWIKIRADKNHYVLADVRMVNADDCCGHRPYKYGLIMTCSQFKLRKKIYNNLQTHSCDIFRDM